MTYPLPTRTFQFIILFYLNTSVASMAQECQPDSGCSFPSAPGGGTVHIGNHTDFQPITTLDATHRKDRFFLMSGETYEWSTRDEDGGMTTTDTELTVYNGIATVRLCFGNDPDGNGAFVSYVAPSNVQVYVYVSQAPCSNISAPTAVVWRCASCAELPEVVVPVSGSEEVECGSNIRLRDAGGTDYYPHNTNGRVILHASNSAAVNLHGSYAIAVGGDRLTLYDGVGTSGTELADYDNAGFLDFTGDPGQTITARFNSDATVFMAGFDLEVSYVGDCTDVGIAERSAMRWSVLTDPAQGTVTIRSGSNTIAPEVHLFDATGRAVHTARTRTAAYEGDMTLALPRTPGYYFLRLGNGKQMETHRVLVQ